MHSRIEVRDHSCDISMLPSILLPPDLSHFSLTVPGRHIKLPEQHFYELCAWIRTGSKNVESCVEAMATCVLVGSRSYTRLMFLLVRMRETIPFCCCRYALVYAVTCSSK